MNYKKGHLKVGEQAIFIDSLYYPKGTKVIIKSIGTDEYDEYVDISLLNSTVILRGYYSWRFQSITTPKGNKKICVNQGVNVKSHVSLAIALNLI